MRKLLWRDSGRRLRFLGVDGRAFILVILAVYHISLWTFLLAIAGIVGLMFLERLGYTIPNALRRIKVLAVGEHRPALMRSRLSRHDR